VFSNSAVTFANPITAPVVNTAGNVNAGGLYIAGDAEIGGNLVVLGNTTTVDVQTLSVEDPMIQMASNATGDLVDIGFYGQWQTGPNPSVQYGGLVRDHLTRQWNLFSDVYTQPSLTVDWVGSARDDLNIGNLSTTGNIVTGAITATSIVLANGDSLTPAGSDFAGNLSVGGEFDAGGNAIVAGSIFLGRHCKRSRQCYIV
jgi:hypothetical protein